MLGIFAGYNFCRNILWDSGEIGRGEIRQAVITEQKCIGDFVCSLYQNLYRWFSRILQRRLPLFSRGPVRKVFRQSDIRFSRNK